MDPKKRERKATYGCRRFERSEGEFYRKEWSCGGFFTESYIEREREREGESNMVERRGRTMAPSVVHARQPSHDRNV